MFNSNNKKDYNPNENVLGNLTANQKMSVINLLGLIATSDGTLNKKEIEYLNTCSLGYSFEKCASYLDAEGTENMFNDLNHLTSFQKDYLIITGFELIYCDGKANEKEMNIFGSAFEKLGYTEDAIIGVIQKATLFSNKFM